MRVFSGDQLPAAGIQHGAADIAALHGKNVGQGNLLGGGDTLEGHESGNLLHELLFQFGFHCVVRGSCGDTRCNYVDAARRLFLGELAPFLGLQREE